MSRHFAVALTILTLIGSASILSACNTTAGVGQDVSATGRAVTDTAQTVKQKLPSP